MGKKCWASRNEASSHIFLFANSAILRKTAIIMTDPTVLPVDFFTGTRLEMSGTVWCPLILAKSVNLMFDSGCVNDSEYIDDSELSSDNSTSREKNPIYFQERAFYNYLAGKKSQLATQLLGFTSDKLCAYREFLAQRIDNQGAASALRLLNKLTVLQVAALMECENCEVVDQIISDFGNMRV